MNSIHLELKQLIYAKYVPKNRSDILIHTTKMMIPRVKIHDEG